MPTSEETFLELARSFGKKLRKIKSERPDVNWYPFNSIDNVGHIAPLLPQEIIERILSGQHMRILDIGPADGDMGYFMESLGCEVDFLDNTPTNYNKLQGLSTSQVALKSRAKIIDQDVDWSFTLPRAYELTLALGLLYHLRNPMHFLMTLALNSENMVLSTRVIQQAPNGLTFGNQPIAYLVDTRESGNDSTNYWMFTEEGLRRVLKRCGWLVLNKRSLGCNVGSDPADPSRDQRMFVFCRRVQNWADLTKHHDF